MNRRLTATLAVLAAVMLGGCSTYVAYDGPRRPRSEVAVLSMPRDVAPRSFTIDGTPIEKDGVVRIEVLPGPHVVGWTYRYPNGFDEPFETSLVAGPGETLVLRHRFYPDRASMGPLLDAGAFALDVVLLPLRLLVPPSSDEAPDGSYYWWVTGEAGAVVAGIPPDVPQGHQEITVVPLD